MIPLISLLSACSGGKAHISATDLLKSIESSQAPVIIDVRSQTEYEAGRVPGAIHISFWSAFTTDKLTEHDSSEPLVLYCEHGPRAGIAKFAFSMAGYEKIFYLEGHMAGWKKAKLPMERKNNSRENSQEE